MAIDERVDELRRQQTYPAVSVLIPMDRQRPGNPEDAGRLRNAIDEASRRITEELGDHEMKDMIRRLEEAAASVDLANPSDGLGLFVSPDETHVVPLPFPVRERVEVAPRFAVRDLLHGSALTPRYRILVLGKTCHLWTGTGRSLLEVASGGFPFELDATPTDPSAPVITPTHTRAPDEEHRQFLRGVDAALGRVTGSALPLVVIGAERTVAFFEEVSDHADSIVGTVMGNHERASADELVELALPVVEAYGAEQRSNLAAEVMEAFGVGRAVRGMQESWDAARAGRARILLLEEDFEYPARISDGQLEPADEPGPEVIDDAVERLIDIVLDTGAEVVFYGAGELPHGPVALLLRY